MTASPTILISANRRDHLLQYLRDLWEYRDVLQVLVWRDIKVRYKQTVLGVAWVILQPTLTMLIFSIFFGKLARIPSDGVPYPVFVFCGLLPWQLFAKSLTDASNSLVANRQLLTKVYFPRLIIPLAAVLGGLMDFLLAFVLLLGLMIGYGIFPPLSSLWAFPLLTLLASMAALSVGIWLSALNVEYRDVHYTLPFLTQLWMFASPIAYPSSLVPEAWRLLYGFNPMAGVVEGFRWAFLGTGATMRSMFWVSILATLAIGISGVVFFRRVERSFADIV